MKRVMKHVEHRQNMFQQHKLFSLITSDQIPLDKKLHLMPIMTLFVMNFRDMNKWVIRFDDENDRFRQTINGNTREDETHSRLFLEDWRKLGFDTSLNWRTSDLLWWLFFAENTEVFRKCGVEFMRLSVADQGDPLIRFAHSEAGESCGHVFFETITPIATALSADNGVDYRYFGQHHLDRETGHMLNSTGVFEDEALTDDQYRLSIMLSDKMFHIFDTIHDSFYQYITQYCLSGRVPAKNNDIFFDIPCYPDASSDLKLPDATKTDATQQPLVKYLLERKQRAESHEFYQWLQFSDLPAIDKLRRFFPLWIFDCLGYRDLNHYIINYPSPQNAFEVHVNTVSSNLARHSRLAMADWLALELDDHLGWRASDALEFFFLDPMMDNHRRALIKFGMLMLQFEDPFLRLWFLEILEASGHAFFHHCQRVAVTAEQQNGIRLNYLANRHHLVHDHNGKLLDTIAVKSIPIHQEQVQVITMFIDTIFDALEQNLSSSLKFVQANRFFSNC